MTDEPNQNPVARIEALETAIDNPQTGLDALNRRLDKLDELLGGTGGIEDRLWDLEHPKEAAAAKRTRQAKT